MCMEHGTEGQHLIIIYYVNLPPGESGDEYIEREDYPMCQQVYDSEEYSYSEDHDHFFEHSGSKVYDHKFLYFLFYQTND